jgi:hypothetical protein
MRDTSGSPPVADEVCSYNRRTTSQELNQPRNTGCPCLYTVFPPTPPILLCCAPAYGAAITLLSVTSSWFTAPPLTRSEPRKVAASFCISVVAAALAAGDRIEP